MSAQSQSVIITVSTLRLLDELKKCLIDIKSVTRASNIELVMAENKKTRGMEIPDVQVWIDQP